MYGTCKNNFSDKTMRKKSGTLFTFQLAFVDTLMLIFLPFHIHEKQAFKWVFGSFLCQLTSSGEFLRVQLDLIGWKCQPIRDVIFTFCI